MVGGGGDPLAQSFVIDEEDGMFITSLDVYFATKSDTIPVRAEIRNMVNGYPGQKVVTICSKIFKSKFSKYKYRCFNSNYIYF